MKFIHIADFHFDSPFVNLSDKEGLGDLCRLAQRKALKKVIDYAKENEVEAIFIAGDLYEQAYIRQTTIEYINNLFKEIPETKIYIAPGNHDPLIKNSYYNKFKWNDNVKIFTSKVEKVETQEADIYGYGFDDYYCKDSKIEELKIENENKINILVMHADLDASQNQENPYNPISKKVLEEKNFDYIALGHIHKPNFEENIVYPGSAFPLGFDELGARGMVVGKVEKGKIEKEFIKLKDIEFYEEEIDVTEILSKEELIEKINSEKFETLGTTVNKLIKITLKGKRNFEIDPYELYKFVTNEKIIKIKNQTNINYDLEKISKETSLRGIFAKKMLEKLGREEKEETKKIIENAIEIGLEILE